jgi:hypothetical protein
MKKDWLKLEKDFIIEGNKNSKKLMKFLKNNIQEEKKTSIPT